MMRSILPPILGIQMSVIGGLIGARGGSDALSLSCHTIAFLFLTATFVLHARSGWLHPKSLTRHPVVLRRLLGLLLLAAAVGMFATLTAIAVFGPLTPAPVAAPADDEPTVAEPLVDEPGDPDLERARRSIDAIEQRMRRCHAMPEMCVRPQSPEVDR